MWDQGAATTRGDQVPVPPDPIHFFLQQSGKAWLQPNVSMKEYILGIFREIRCFSKSWILRYINWENRKKYYSSSVSIEASVSIETLLAWRSINSQGQSKRCEQLFLMQVKGLRCMLGEMGREGRSSQSPPLPSPTPGRWQKFILWRNRLHRAGFQDTRHREWQRKSHTEIKAINACPLLCAKNPETLLHLVLSSPPATFQVGDWGIFVWKNWPGQEKRPPTRLPGLRLGHTIEKPS
jgi:hypothetical protein